MADDIISVDIETHDPHLKDMGPGETRRDGYILGVAINILNKKPEYLDPHTDRTRLQSLLSSDTPKVCHNAAYDIPWLESAGFTVNGRVHDTMIAAALLDEYQYSFSLDTCARVYLGETKGDDEIKQYAEDHQYKGPPQGHLAKMPRELVAKYAKTDARQTLDLINKMLPLLKQQGLYNVYMMEVSLFPLMRAMRQAGIRIDTTARGALSEELQEKEAVLSTSLEKTYGTFNIRSGKQIASVLTSMNIPYPRTDKGNPMLGKAELAKITGIGIDILHVREIRTLLDNFIDGSFLKFLIGDRLHPQFLQTKRDDGGTVSGRFSCRNPNLQQAPARHPIYGDKIRALFIPDEGRRMLALDYDGIESRIFAHYAAHGDAIRAAYVNDPELDYHQAVADMAGIDRKSAKTINFAALYGAGVTKISQQLGRGLIDGKKILQQYHQKFPAVKATMTAVSTQAKRKGYIKTMSGRRAHVSTQQKRDNKYYIFLNRLIQGTAADLLKKAMLDAWNAGIFDVLTPHLLVHDELVASVGSDKESTQAIAELRHIMETAYTFRVPIRVSGGVGDNWAKAH